VIVISPRPLGPPRSGDPPDDRRFPGAGHRGHASLGMHRGRANQAVLQRYKSRLVGHLSCCLTSSALNKANARHYASRYCFRCFQSRFPPSVNLTMTAFSTLLGSEHALASARWVPFKRISCASSTHAPRIAPAGPAGSPTPFEQDFHPDARTHLGEQQSAGDRPVSARELSQRCPVAAAAGARTSSGQYVTSWQRPTIVPSWHRDRS
jgi:hypothetical protein